MIERDETRERFLGAIAERLEPETVEEAHLFPPIRQGGQESGVAVLAVRHGAADIAHRLTVYTAKYRLTLKGPERGKWEFALQAEADAPLVTIDEVVRGVQRRSGDADDPVKLAGDEFRALLAPAKP